MTLYAALGETQSFQVIVQAPAGGLSNVNVFVSNLTGPGGAVIASAAQITLYGEHYVTVTNGSPNLGGSNQPLPPGLFPDALIPFVDPITHQPLSGATYTAVPFTLAAGHNQPVWIDVAVPRTAVPGVYTGVVTVTSGQGTTTSSITLTVWHFALPVAPTLQSSFGFHGAQTDVKSDEEVLLAHRIMPFQIKTSDSPSLLSEGLNIAGLPFFSDEDLSQCTLTNLPSTAQMTTAIATYAPGLNHYFYAADEIDPCVGQAGFVSALKQAAVTTHAAGSQMLVTATPNPALYDDGAGGSIIDIWTMLPEMFVNADANTISTVRSKGNKLWMYNAQVQDAYSPKWEVDFAPVNYRIVPGFHGQALGFTGMLYSGVDLWTTDPWNNLDNPAGGAHFNGEDILVYPGAQAGVAGVVPSMRLKYLRDGVNDYDYIQLLKNQGQGAWAMGLVNTVAANWSTWSQDPVLLESVRHQLGAKLDLLAGGHAVPESPTLTGTHWASVSDFPALKNLSYDFAVITVPPDSPAVWTATLDAAQANHLKLIIGAYPPPYTLDSTTGRWTISAQGQDFLNYLASRASLVMGVFVFNEPYWVDPFTNQTNACGALSAAQLRALRTQIQSVWPDAKIYQDIGTPSWWAPSGAGWTACIGSKYADQSGVADFVGIWDYPFTSAGYDRAEALASLTKEGQFIAASMSPAQTINSNQAFSCSTCGGTPLVWPSDADLLDWNCAVRNLGFAGVSWYVWRQSIYSDFLANHSEDWPLTTAAACALPPQNPINPNPPTLVNTTLSNLKVYPDPWRADKHAGHFITFDGLNPGTTIRIFTASAHAVKKLSTDGPKVGWDLTNDKGDKVASGIYLYLITDGQRNKARGKVVVIR